MFLFNISVNNRVDSFNFGPISFVVFLKMKTTQMSQRKYNMSGAKYLLFKSFYRRKTNNAYNCDFCVLNERVSSQICNIAALTNRKLLGLKIHVCVS